MQQYIKNPDFKALFDEKAQLSASDFSNINNSLLSSVCHTITRADYPEHLEEKWLNDDELNIKELGISFIPFYLLDKINSNTLTQKQFNEFIDSISKCLYDVKVGIVEGEFEIEQILNIRNILLEYNHYFKLPELRDLVDDVLESSKVKIQYIVSN